MTAYKTLLEKTAEIHDIGRAAAVLGWDREVNMPTAGNPERTQQLTTLYNIAHRLSTSTEYADLIAQAAEEVADADPDSTEKRLVDLLQFEYERESKLSAELVAEMGNVSGVARPAWIHARANNDFNSFKPHLEKIVELCQAKAEAYGYEEEMYDALLNGYERGMKASQVRTIFDALKAEIQPLFNAIMERGAEVDNSILSRNYPVETQKEFATYLTNEAGYDFERGHLGTVVHPFMTSFGRNDVRITNRWFPDFINSGLFGALHEAGHAIYEQGFSEDIARTPLENGASLGIHESQARLFENLIGRSDGFWKRHYPALQNSFPEALGDVAQIDFYRAINKVQPSFIRVEADELTYNFHIILRFELEQAMLNGDLAVADLPTAWNDKMQELLGITPPTDTEGCLQDVHWSSPSFGYFPTYALGNLYGAQFIDAMVRKFPMTRMQLNNGEIASLLKWLSENVHIHGSKRLPNEIVENATGNPLSHESFVTYLKNKYTEIYKL